METTLIVFSCLVGIGMMFFGLLSLVPFLMLFKRIKRKHPKYYAQIGRSYHRTGIFNIAVRDDTSRPTRRRAMGRLLQQVYRGVPKLFLRDKKAEWLAQAAQSTLRVALPLTAIGLFILLPVDSFALVLKKEPTVVFPTKAAASQHTAGPVTYVHQGNGTTTTQTTGSSSSTTSTTTTTTTYGDPVSQTPLYPTLNSVPQVQTYTPAPGQDAALTRTDLNNALAGVAAPGQKRSQKVNVCNQLISSEPTQSNLGPSQDTICTNGNLLTYSAY